MIDGIVDAIVETASPVITRWRTFFLIVSLVLTSPDLDKLFSQDFYLIDLKSLVALFGEILSSSKVVVAFFLAALCYFFLPFVNSYIIKFIISKNISIAGSLVERIECLRGSPKENIERVVEESFDAKKMVAKASIKSIDIYKESAETAFMVCIMYLVLSIYLKVVCIVLAILLVFGYILFAYVISRKILIEYLKNVAPYKVLEDYVKYFILVK
ncbi:hypothetical protein [Teredinibacter sp. KSP-S5-2]|uniref:hypothetical protein n=1 Tax=Teredinibacter sp. KSP-S5-2 TaxID=3034506 RepID=UPI002934465F|nr:hypothetical protein [Teredinibacter sp. KSP-S5-2]WNO09850.1 hypothetical protein P5V12_01510 [Teredinibacter sp. KSP-S5-2]